MRPRTRCIALIAGLSAALFIGCATRRESVSLNLNPRSIGEVRGDTHVATRDPAHPTVALVLGGGGLRGFAHVGVLSALEELGVEPDIIVGTSAGAVVGAAYASGLTPDQLRSVAHAVRISSLVDLTLSTGGIMRGNNLAEWIEGVTGGIPIENFPRRFAAVATDLQSGQAVLLDRGSAGSVVQASSAVPGVNVPVPYGSGHLVDGGVTSLVPVRFARAMGADIVIAVDIYCRSPSADGLGAATVISRVMHVQSCLLAEAEIAQADVLIAPAPSVPGMSSKEAQQLVIQAGYEAAHAALRDWRVDTRPACLDDDSPVTAPATSSTDAPAARSSPAGHLPPSPTPR